MHYLDIGIHSFVLFSTKPASNHSSPVRNNMSIRGHKVLCHFWTNSAPFYLGPYHPPSFQMREMTPPQNAGAGLSCVPYSRRATMNLSLLHHPPTTSTAPPSFLPLINIIATTAPLPGSGEQETHFYISRLNHQ